jgi:aspartyl-tRNA(Asn)/glutamyl-tRNA(Gln) amidotransferase subunit C
MTKITREDIIKLARISCIQIEDCEIEVLRKEIEEVLEYASRLQEYSVQQPRREVSVLRTTSIMREDVAVVINSEPLLEQAPQREGMYFVVPIVIAAKDSV